MSENGFAGGGAVGGKTATDGRTSRDDEVLGIDPVEANDAFGSRHGDAYAFLATLGQFDQEPVRFAAKRPGFERAAPQLVQLQTQAVPIIIWISFDELESLHGVEKAVDSGFVQTKFGRELSEAHLGTVFAKMQEKPKGFLQRFAGASVGISADAGTRGFVSPQSSRQVRILSNGAEQRRKALAARSIVDRIAPKSI